MRQQILGILAEIEKEREPQDETTALVYDRVCQLLNDLTSTDPKLTDFELLSSIRDARSLMLDIILRLRPEWPNRVDRLTELKADEFWDGSMREHFVEAAEKLAARPEIRDLYKEVHETENQPLNDFLNQLDTDTNQDLGCFVYSMLTADAEKATL